MASGRGIPGVSRTEACKGTTTRLRGPLASGLVVGLALFWLCLALPGQPSSTLPNQSGSGGSAEAGQAAPSRLKIQVLSEVPLTEPAGALSANSLQVRITDEWGMPVRGATVSFRLPEAGPGGAFLNGLSSEIAITDERGEAAVKGFDWRAEAGVSFIHVIAAYGSVRAGGMAEVQLTRSSGVTNTPRGHPPPRPATEGAEAAPSSTILGRTEADNPVSAPRPSVSSVRDQIPEPPAGYATPDIRPRRDAYTAPEAETRGEASAVDAAPDEARRRDIAGKAYVRTKGGANGGSKALKVLIVVGAAAGGAIAVGLASGSSASGSPPGGPAAAPPIRIGTPTISVGTAGAPR